MPRTLRPRAAATVVKRSLLIAGHATSISLEQEFWDGLRLIAAARALSIAALVAEIDSARHAANLSSAVRVFVLRHFQAGAIPPAFSSEIRDEMASGQREPMPEATMRAGRRQ